MSASNTNNNTNTGMTTTTTGTSTNTPSLRSFASTGGGSRQVSTGHYSLNRFLGEDKRTQTWSDLNIRGFTPSPSGSSSGSGSGTGAGSLDLSLSPASGAWKAFHEEKK